MNKKTLSLILFCSFYENVQTMDFNAFNVSSQCRDDESNLQFLFQTAPVVAIAVVAILDVYLLKKMIKDEE